MEEKELQVLVSIQCTVYNHEPYLRQCIDGFVMQQTNFPFEAIVHDDCSTIISHPQKRMLHGQKRWFNSQQKQRQKVKTLS